MTESTFVTGYPLTDFTKGFLMFFESRVHCLVDVRDYVICDNNSNDIWMYVDDGNDKTSKGWLLLNPFLSHTYGLE